MSLFEEICLGIGTVVSIWIPLLSMRRSDKRHKKEEERANERAKKKAEDDLIAKQLEIEKARNAEMNEIKQNIGWLMKQFGKSPNGGGIMEQMKDHIAFTKEGFRILQEGQQTTNEKVAENIQVTLTTAQRVEDHLKLVEAGLIK